MVLLMFRASIVASKYGSQLNPIVYYNHVSFIINYFASEFPFLICLLFCIHIRSSAPNFLTEYKTRCDMAEPICNISQFPSFLEMFHLEPHSGLLIPSFWWSTSSRSLLKRGVSDVNVLIPHTLLVYPMLGSFWSEIICASEFGSYCFLASSVSLEKSMSFRFLMLMWSFFPLFWQPLRPPFYSWCCKIS